MVAHNWRADFPKGFNPSRCFLEGPRGGLILLSLPCNLRGLEGRMADKKLCFVIGPIGDEGSDFRIHADWLLEGIIEPVMSEFPDFTVKRADHDPRPGLIDAQMINDLLNADLVIADLSFSNPNAFYEIGIRHMAQKPIIHMQLATEKPPFDLSLYRAIKFSRLKYRDLALARDELKRSVEAVLSKGYEIENPV